MTTERRRSDDGARGEWMEDALTRVLILSMELLIRRIRKQRTHDPKNWGIVSKSIYDVRKFRCAVRTVEQASVCFWWKADNSHDEFELAGRRRRQSEHCELPDRLSRPFPRGGRNGCRNEHDEWSPMIL